MASRHLITVAVTALALLVGPAPSGQASPPAQDETGTCTWTPIAPTVVNVGGIKRVTAALAIGPCTLVGNPTEKTACLSINDTGSPGKCATTSTANPATVYTNYVPGATYVMTGRGCVVRYVQPNRLCQTFGPDSYTL